VIIPGGPLKTVFIILMENHSWSTIKASPKAAYINGTLVPMGGHAENYSTPPANHPSEPNYIWLEAGGNLGITDDNDPAQNHQSTTDHLVTKLQAAGVTWKAYVEDITGNDCPLAASGTFAPRHTPMLFFDDTTDGTKTTSANCKAHVRPYTELAGDLTNGTVARYNFITPNLCNDMHGVTLACGSANFDEIGTGDTWLKNEVPKILASNAYKDNGVLFITWDEGDEPLGQTASDGPIPMLVISPKAKVNYTSQTKFTHSSMLRTVQEIFGVAPLLRDAANATNLSEFFTSFP
jgi:phospholipase C